MNRLDPITQAPTLSGPNNDAFLRLRDAWMAISLALIGLVSVAVSALAISKAGIGWDSGVDTQAALEVRAIEPGTGLYDAYEQVFLTSEFYGVLVQWAADLVYQLLGGNGPLPTDLAVTYQLQAAVNLTLFVISSVLVSAVVAVIVKSRVTGLFVWACLVSLPILMGFAGINFKDLPVASGLLLVSAGVALLSAYVVGNSRSLVWSVLLVGLGTFVALGVRIGAWVLVGAILAPSVGLFTALSLRSRQPGIALVQLLAPLMGVLGGVLGVYLLHPIARIDIARWAWDAYLVSGSYPWIGTIRVLGQDVTSTSLPWWYVPAWLMAQLPILMIGSVVLGLVFWVSRIVTSTTDALRKIEESDHPSTLAFTPFAVQALVLPVGLVVVGVTLYDGIRHLTFAIPALIVMTAPLASFVNSGTGPVTGKSKVIAVIAAAGLVAIPMGNAVSSIRWFPYMYAYVNPIAVAVDEGRDWEYDYWGTTVQEGADRLANLGQEVIVVSPPIGPLGNLEVAGGVSVDEVSPETEYGLYVFRRWYADVPTKGCESVFQISRGGIVLGEGAICRGPESLAQLRGNVREP